MKDLLNEEVKSELGILSNMQEIGTTTYSAIVTGINTLSKSAVDLEKAEAERLKNELLLTQEKLKWEQMEQERKERLDLQAKQLELQQKQLELQEKQHKATVRSNTLQILTGVGVALLSAAITVWGTNTTLEFEKEGTVTTSAGKGFLGRIFTKK